MLQMSFITSSLQSHSSFSYKNSSSQHISLASLEAFLIDLTATSIPCLVEKSLAGHTLCQTGNVLDQRAEIMLTNKTFSES